MIKGGLKILKIFLFAVFFASNVNVFAENCIPKDHVGNSDPGLQGVANIPDNIVEIVSSQIYGPIRGHQITDIFSGSLWQEIDVSDRDWSKGVIQKTFLGITQNVKFQVIFYLSVIFLISYLGFAFAMGYSKISASDLTSQFIKIAIIVFFTTPSGWDFYCEYIVRNITDAARYFNKAIIASMYNIPVEKVSSPFQPINMVFEVLFHAGTWRKIGALFWAGGLMFVALLLVIMLYVIVTTILITAKVTLLYLTTIIIASVLLAMGPFFAIALLFERTKPYFDKWVSNLFGIFMQQYLVFLTLFLFCVIISVMIKGVFYFETCHAPVLLLKIMVKFPDWLRKTLNAIIYAFTFGFGPKNIIPEYVLNVKIPLFSTQMPVIPIFDMSVNVFSVGCIIVVAMLFARFVEMAAEIGTSIANASMSSKNIAGSSLEKLNTLQDKADSAVKDMAQGAVTGAIYTKGLEAVSKRAEKLKGVIDKREAEGKQGFVTNALKVLHGMTKPARLYTDVVQSDEKVAKMRAIEENQKIAKNVQEQEIGKLVGEGKAYASASQLTDEDKKAIDAKVKEVLKEEGHSGVFGEGGKELPITEEFINETIESKITSHQVTGVGPRNIVKAVQAFQQGNGVKESVMGAVKNISSTDLGRDLTEYSQPATTKGKVQRRVISALKKTFITNSTDNKNGS